MPPVRRLRRRRDPAESRVCLRWGAFRVPEGVVPAIGARASRAPVPQPHQAPGRTRRGASPGDPGARRSGAPALRRPGAPAIPCRALPRPRPGSRLPGVTGVPGVQASQALMSRSRRRAARRQNRQCNAETHRPARPRKRRRENRSPRAIDEARLRSSPSRRECRERFHDVIVRRSASSSASRRMPGPSHAPVARKPGTIAAVRLGWGPLAPMADTSSYMTRTRRFGGGKGRGCYSALVYPDRGSAPPTTRLKEMRR